MRIQINMPAPAIEALAPNGDPVNLQTYAGSALWLILSRWATCPFCSLRLDRIAQHYDRVQAAGLRTLVVFPSPVERVAKYTAKYAPPFDTAADVQEVTFGKYGVENSWAGSFKSFTNMGKVVGAMRAARSSPLPFAGALDQMPADFIIDAAGVVRHAHYGEELDDGYSVDDAIGHAASLVVTS